VSSTRTPFLRGAGQGPRTAAKPPGSRLLMWKIRSTVPRGKGKAGCGGDYYSSYFRAVMRVRRASRMSVRLSPAPPDADSDHQRHVERIRLLHHGAHQFLRL